MPTKRTEKLKIEVKLVELVKDRPVLYVKSFPGHSDAILKANTWNKIYDLVGENAVVDSGKSCEKLWGSIWQQYLAFKRRVAGKTGQGGGARPYFRLENAMREFDDKFYQEKTYCNDDGGCNDDDFEDPSPVVTISSESGTDFTSESPEPFQRNSKAECSPSASSTFNNFSMTKPRSHEKKRKEREFDEELMEVLKSQNTMDEFEAFAATIAIKMRKMDPRKASEVQFLIHQVIYNAEKES